MDRTCQDLRGNESPFGGITVAWGGDFQQTLPVIVRGSREEIVSACIQRSPLWNHVNILHLKKNMRVDPNNPDSARFAQWLLDVGHGKELPLNHSFTIPAHMKLQGPETAEALVSEIYPNLHLGSALQGGYFLERSILCARNTEVDGINAHVMNQFPGDSRIYSSIDKAVFQNRDQDEDYPIEYLNSLEIPGIPTSQLKLKIGVPLMLLRNIDPAQGLCNGTRMKLMEMNHKVLHVSTQSLSLFVHN